MGWRISMRIDWYTKGVLTVIALLLAVIAVDNMSARMRLKLRGRLPGSQFSGAPDSFFDTRTGEIWSYDSGGVGPAFKLRLTKLGAPLVKEK
jgi:hypothetical protein